MGENNWIEKRKKGKMRCEEQKGICGGNGI